MRARHGYHLRALTLLNLGVAKFRSFRIDEAEAISQALALAVGRAAFSRNDCQSRLSVTAAFAPSR